MFTKRFRDERGPTDAGWLKSMHSFSFGHYMDPAHMGYGVLRVINDDHVIPGAGFGSHPHHNMEIISYVLSGALEHKDSMGTGSVIRPGEVQLMSAGNGVVHSEYNHSPDEPVHFLQMWVMPNVRNEAPSYQQGAFTQEGDTNRFVLAVSPDGAEGSLTIRQDARLYVGRFAEGAQHIVPLNPKRRYWLQLAEGIARVDGDEARAGDGYAIEGENQFSLEAISAINAVLFDLP